MIGTYPEGYNKKEVLQTMFELLFFPFRLMAGLLGGIFSLVGGLLRGMFSLFGGLFVAFISIMTGIWPIMLVGCAFSLVFGIIRSLWPLICIGAIGFLCYVLYQAGVQHAKDHPDDRFAQFINRVRS